MRLVVVERLPTASSASTTPNKPALTSSASSTSIKDSHRTGTEKEKPKLWEGPGIEVGRALVNYSAAEITRIKGMRSADIIGLLGYADSEYVALRENISFFVRESRPGTPAFGEREKA